MFDDKKIEQIKNKYPSGTKIKLTKDMSEEEYPILSGMEGIVDFVDDIGTIHMKWNNGHSLGIIPEVDSFEVIEDEPVKEEEEMIEK